MSHPAHPQHAAGTETAQDGHLHPRWERPSERVQELIRRGAEIVLNPPVEWLEDIEHATLQTEAMRAVRDDPVLAAASRRSLRSILIHWAAANIRDPGAPVPASVGPDALSIARDMIRLGLNEAALHTYRTGQNVAWSKWMQIAFQLTSDPQELQELLEVSARSIASFVDECVVSTSAQMAMEREGLTRGTHAERRETVALIVEGAPMAEARASQRLGYALERTHRAAVIWSENEDFEFSALERAAGWLANLAGVSHAFTVVASAATLWVWVPTDRDVNMPRLEALCRSLQGVRMAVGTAGHGIEGFRRSHLDALSTQRMLARLPEGPRIASFDMVGVVSLLSEDPERVERFVTQTLGKLAHADPDIKDAVLVFLEEGCNAMRAAVRLHTHRNTLLRRLARADELLPRPLDQNRLHVGVALEVARWGKSG